MPVRADRATERSNEYFLIAIRREKRGRDSSLRRPTIPQERDGKGKSACLVRNDGFVELGDGFVAVVLDGAWEEERAAG
jgi:hypothetical protein